MKLLYMDIKTDVMNPLNFKSDGNDQTIIQIPQIPKNPTESLSNLIDENLEESANLLKLIGGYMIVGSIIIGLICIRRIFCVLFYL